MPGTNISQMGIAHISNDGVSLLANGQELFMQYANFPWFKDVPLGKILNVEQPTPCHFYWPDLDVDLSRDIITHPERFPLKAN